MVGTQSGRGHCGKWLTTQHGHQPCGCGSRLERPLLSQALPLGVLRHGEDKGPLWQGLGRPGSGGLWGVGAAAT